MKKLDLIAFFNDVYRIYHPSLRSRNTVSQYESVCRVLDRHNRERHGRPAVTCDLSAELILGSAARLVNDCGRSPATGNRVIRTAAAMWREAAKRGYAARLPDEPLPQYDEPKRLPVAWKPDEFRRVLEATELETGYVGPIPAASWFLGLELFVFWTGARISAVMSVKVADLDATENTVRIDADSQKHRADGLHDLPPDLVDLLGSWGLRERGVGTLFGDWPFDRGQPSWRALNRRLAAILKRADLPATRRDMWHKIRRTHATQITAKKGIAVAQKMLGHSSSKVTERYVDPTQVPRDRATEILDSPMVLGPPRFRIVG